jgi:hypothetical protein
MGAIDRIKDLVREKGVPFEFDPRFGMNGIPKKAIKVDFFCLCGSREYIPHFGGGKLGGSNWVVHCECVGCTKFFRDPIKYSEAQKVLAKKIQEILRVLSLTSCD